MPINFSVKTEARDGVTVLVVSGEVDLAAAPGLREAIDQALAPATPLILDLAAVEFIDSAGSRALALADQSALALGARLLLVPSETVSHVLRIAGLDALFDVYPETADALAAASAQVKPAS